MIIQCLVQPLLIVKPVSFLIGFSYAFFFEGFAQLTVVVGAIITLYILMQATARMNWAEVFGRKAPPAMPVPPPVDEGWKDVNNHGRTSEEGQP